MPPSHCRCLVFLLLVVAATGFLAHPAEAAKRPFAGIVDDAARRHGVDPGLVHAVITVESGYRATAQSPAGAQGLMQLMPATQRDLGVSDAFDPRQNVDAGVAYLRRLTDEFGTVLAIAAYNAGPGAVRRYNGIPPYEETRAYVWAVLVQAAEEHVPPRDRTHAIAEAGLAEPATVRRRARDDHPALNGAAGLEPLAWDEAVNLDDRAGTAAATDQLVNPRGAPTGALRQVADERPLQAGGAAAAHAAADTARRVLRHAADRLIDDECRHRDPASHVTSAPAGSHRGRPGERSPDAASPRSKMRSRTSATDASTLPGHFEHLTDLAAGRAPDPAAGDWPPTERRTRCALTRRNSSPISSGVSRCDSSAAVYGLFRPRPSAAVVPAAAANPTSVSSPSRPSFRSAKLPR